MFWFVAPFLPLMFNSHNTVLTFSISLKAIAPSSLQLLSVHIFTMCLLFVLTIIFSFVNVVNWVLSVLCFSSLLHRVQWYLLLQFHLLVFQVTSKHYSQVSSLDLFTPQIELTECRVHSQHLTQWFGSLGSTFIIYPEAGIVLVFEKKKW